MIEPATSSHVPLLRAELRRSGVTDDELRRARRNGSLAVLTRGTYLPASDPRLGDEVARHRLVAAGVQARVAPDSVVSHVSAAVLHGLPIWALPLRAVHVTRPRRNGGRRIPGLHVHTAPLRADEIVVVDGRPVTCPARTVIDVARTVGFTPAVMIADAALHTGLVTAGALDAAAARARGWPGAPAARRVVAFADGRSESPGESRSRVEIARAGLPAPVLQPTLLDANGRRYRPDNWWPELVTIGEFDGRIKYGRARRGEGTESGETEFGETDPGDVVFAEKLREDAIRATGVRVVRWTWADLSCFAAVAARIRGDR